MPVNLAAGRRGVDPLFTLAAAEAVDWDEFGQAYGPTGELVVCVCGFPFPQRGGAHKYCPYDERPDDED